MEKIFKLNNEFENELLAKTEIILKNSGTAIVPTDTVYGIICDGENAKAKESIYKIKGRPESKPLIGFVKSIDQAKQLAFIPEKFLPFISNRWPGRNTFIFRTRIKSEYVVTRENTIALRIPDFKFVNRLCENFLFLASTSANISFTGSVSNIGLLHPSIIDNVSIVIDGGEICGQESAIWDMTQDIPKLMRGKVLFVCSGNSCRSPMAQAIFQKFVDRRITVVSAGTETNFSGSISREAVEVLREDGIDIENFVSSVIKKEIIEFSDLIFVMEEKHRKMVLELFPNASDRTFVLNIPDPAGGNIYEYRRIRDIIKEKIHDCVLTRIKI